MLIQGEFKIVNAIFTEKKVRLRLHLNNLKVVKVVLDHLLIQKENLLITLIMTLVNTRAAFEKAVTDAVAAVDATVEMIYDNIIYKTPGKTKKYIIMSIRFTSINIQNQGASSDFYSGVIQCNVYVPRGKGTSVLSTLGEAVIDGLNFC